MEDDLDVLPGGVENLEDGFIGHQIEERREVDPLGQRIDDQFVGFARHLNNAELRIIGRFAQELGVDGDRGVGGKSFAGRRKLFGGCDQFHAISITMLRAGRIRCVCCPDYRK